MLSKIQSFLKTILGNQLDDKLKNYFLTGAYKSFLLQISIAALTFLTGLAIARLAGDHDFGVYTIVFTWISVLSVGATLGLDDLLLKVLPVFQKEKQTNQLLSALLWANIRGLIASIIVAITLLILIYNGFLPSLLEYKEYFLWAVWVIPAFVLMHINQAALRAVGQIGRGQLAEKFIQPLAFAILLLAIFIGAGYLDDYTATIARTGSFFITLSVALLLLYKFIRPLKNKFNYQSDKTWTTTTLYMGGASLLLILSTRLDIIMLGFSKVSEAEVGYYNAAVKFTDIAMIPYAVLYTVAAPMFARLYAEGDKLKLQQFFTRTTAIICILITAVLLGLLLFGDWALALFGSNFTEGYTALTILCLSKWLHAFFGPLNYLLLMVGEGKGVVIGLLVSVCTAILLHYLWIPLAGINGAAWATCISLLVYELLLGYFAFTKAGLIPTVFAAFLSKKE